MRFDRDMSRIDPMSMKKKSFDELMKQTTRQLMCVNWDDHMLSMTLSRQSVFEILIMISCSDFNNLSISHL